VQAVDNGQLLSYGLGVVLKFGHLPIKRVKLTIAQARIDHPDGRIRSWEVPVSYLIDWATTVKDGMERARDAMAEWRALDKTPKGIEAWSEKWLRTGHCHFCPVAGQCPKLRSESLAKVGVWFDEFAAPHVDVKITENSPEAIERDLDSLEQIELWVRERRQYAHWLAEGGTQFKNWVLVERTGHRKWNDANEAAAAAEIAKLTGLAPDQLFTSKIKSPAQVEKLVGAAGKELLSTTWHQPVTGRDLIRAGSKVRKPAVPLTATFGS
jgi:hypothetical protein